MSKKQSLKIENKMREMNSTMYAGSGLVIQRTFHLKHCNFYHIEFENSSPQPSKNKSNPSYNRNNHMVDGVLG